jgi:hypothetical protein
MGQIVAFLLVCNVIPGSQKSEDLLLKNSKKQFFLYSSNAGGISCYGRPFHC